MKVLADILKILISFTIIFVFVFTFDHIQLQKALIGNDFSVGVHMRTGELYQGEQGQPVGNVYVLESWFQLCARDRVTQPTQTFNHSSMLVITCFFIVTQFFTIRFCDTIAATVINFNSRLNVNKSVVH